MTRREELILKYLSSGINRNTLILNHLRIIQKELNEIEEKDSNLANVTIPEKGTRDREDETLDLQNLELLQELSSDLSNSSNTIKIFLENLENLVRSKQDKE